METMKKWMLAAILICGTTAVLTSCSDKNDNPVEPVKPTIIATDYSNEDNWLQIPEITKDVDAFYIYSTSYIDDSFKEGAPDFAPIDNEEMRMRAIGEYVTNASVFEESCNVFVPWYRQVGMKYAGEVSKKYGSIDAAFDAEPYTDIKAALDYYFEKCNNGRPFIIAGHSQGSAMVKYVLKNYFKEHPDYYKRMVAAYAIGFSVTKDELAANPHMKFATGESDAGVIVSYNTEGPKNVEENAKNVVVLPGAISINPLNWKLDETYAPASMNKGSLVQNNETGEIEFVDIGADAQINLARGVVVTTTSAKPIELADFFGPASFHDNDYTFYYKNLEENVAKRIATYKGLIPTDYSNEDCWLQIPEITKDVDAFYIYGTSYIDDSYKEGAPDYAPIDNEEMILRAMGEYITNASVFEESCNVFMPLYRQVGMKYAGVVSKKYGSIEAGFDAEPYADIQAALDYYFENCNNGRPFIIAGHSQGSAMVKHVLKNYFKKHPDYYKLMVAAYAIGFSVTKDELAAYPHMKFATGESDAGVIVSYNTEGPKNVEENAKNVVVLPGCISINPLNWKLDETYAPASMNKGSLALNKETNEYEIKDIGVDAQIILARGVIVTNTTAPVTEGEDFFGPASFHEDDYQFFYNNIKENVAKRIATYKNSAK